MNIDGERVRELRLEKGLSQAALGKLIGRSQQAVSQIEGGHTNEPRAVIPLAKVFGVPISDIMPSGDWPEGADTAILGEDAESPPEGQMNDVYRLIGQLQSEVEHLKVAVKELKEKAEPPLRPRKRRATS